MNLAIATLAVAKLAIRVVAPALRPARREQRASVIRSRRETADRHWNGAPGLGAVAELCVSIRAPARCRPRLEHSARVGASHRDLGDTAAVETRTTDRNWRAAQRGLLISELAVGVFAPAHCRAHLEQRAGVRISHRNLGDVHVLTEVDSHYLILGTCARCAVAPALYFARLEHRARVIHSRRDLSDDGVVAEDCDRPRTVTGTGIVCSCHLTPRAGRSPQPAPLPALTLRGPLLTLAQACEPPKHKPKGLSRLDKDNMK